MKVSEYIEFLRNGEINTLPISDVGDMSINPITPPTAKQLANQAKCISYINLANLAVHKKFNLLKKEYEIDNPLDGEEYKLPSDFMTPISAHYAVDKTPISIKDTSTNMVSDVDTAVSILIDEPYKARIKGTDSLARPLIILVYAASPKTIINAATDLKISAAYTDAIINFAAYKAHTVVSGSIQDVNNTYYMRYKASCKEIVEMGLHGNNQIETNNKLIDNGFV
ncbi:MAG: hypothetical protein U9O94_06065 [Nanoarchaeota archaeon]|nr:hypothetical protein [Nanoarchaeota archaeon]